MRNDTTASRLAALQEAVATVCEAMGANRYRTRLSDALAASMVAAAPDTVDPTSHAADVALAEVGSIVLPLRAQGNVIHFTMEMGTATHDDGRTLRLLQCIGAFRLAMWLEGPATAKTRWYLLDLQPLLQQAFELDALVAR